jgi:hypothetical protein
MAKKLPALGRRYAFDPRDQQFPLRAVVAPAQTVADIKIKYWPGLDYWGNQGQVSACCGYSAVHLLHSSPITYRKQIPVYDPVSLYREAQKVDEWPGEDYEGTSVRAVMKVLQDAGFIESYHWAVSLLALRTAVKSSPVVVGTNWYEDMFFPDKKGKIKIGGSIAGGHAYLIDGINENTETFRIKNSWGRSWGRRGYAYISFENMQQLMSEEGEICLAIEKKKV